MAAYAIDQQVLGSLGNLLTRCVQCYSIDNPASLTFVILIDSLLVVL